MEKDTKKGTQKKMNLNHEQEKHIASRMLPLPEMQLDKTIRHNHMLKICFVMFCVVSTIITLCLQKLSHSQHSERQLQTIVQGVDSTSPSSPPLLWLLYYPNSGEAFSSETIQFASGVNTASNNGKYTFNPSINEWIQDAHASVPIYSNRPNGPFLISPSLPIPVSPQYIVTKTSCGGYPPSSSITSPSNHAVDAYYYCHDCPIEQTFRKPHEFWMECASSISYTGGTATDEKYKSTHYDHRNVQRAIHLVRDPFDVIVDTFHSEYKKHASQNDFNFIHQFPYDTHGFHKWCSYISTRENNAMNNHDFFRRQYGEELGNELWTLAQSVPCYTEFFHYSTWHNHAAFATHEMRVPIYVLHYESFLRQLEPTIQALLLFCQLPFVHVPKRFFYQKYDYWSHDEMQDARLFMGKIVSRQAFTFLSVYLGKIGFH